MGSVNYRMKTSNFSEFPKKKCGKSLLRLSAMVELIPPLGVLGCTGSVRNYAPVHNGDLTTLTGI